MKNTLILLATLAFATGLVGAKNIHFPEKGDVMFTLNIPDNWEPDKDEDNVLEATSPQEHVYLAAWELKDAKDIKELGNDIESILEDHAKDIHMDGEPHEAKPGGMDGRLFKGHAKDEEDDHAIEFFALIVTHNKRAALIFIEANADTPKEEADKLQKILESIKPAK